MLYAQNRLCQGKWRFKYIFFQPSGSAVLPHPLATCAHFYGLQPNRLLALEQQRKDVRLCALNELLNGREGVGAGRFAVASFKCAVGNDARPFRPTIRP